MGASSRVRRASVGGRRSMDRHTPQELYVATTRGSLGCLTRRVNKRAEQDCIPASRVRWLWFSQLCALTRSYCARDGCDEQRRNVETGPHRVASLKPSLKLLYAALLAFKPAPLILESLLNELCGGSHGTTTTAGHATGQSRTSTVRMCGLCGLCGLFHEAWRQ